MQDSSVSVMQEEYNRLVYNQAVFLSSVRSNIS